MNEYIGYLFTIATAIITVAVTNYFIRRKIDAETREKNSLSKKADAETLGLYQEMMAKEAMDNRELRQMYDDLSKCQDNLEGQLKTMGDEIKSLKELLAIKDGEIFRLKQRLTITESDNDQLRLKIERLEARQ